MFILIISDLNYMAQLFRMKRTTCMLYVEEISDSDHSIPGSCDVIPKIEAFNVWHNDETAAFDKSQREDIRSSPRASQRSPPTIMSASNKDVSQSLKLKQDNRVYPVNRDTSYIPGKARDTSTDMIVTDDVNSTTTSRTNHRTPQVGRALNSEKQTQKYKRNLVDDYELKTITDTLLYAVLKHLFFSMKLSGKFCCCGYCRHHRYCCRRNHHHHHHHHNADGIDDGREDNDKLREICYHIHCTLSIVLSNTITMLECEHEHDMNRCSN